MAGDMPGPGFIPGDLHLNDLIAPSVADGAARPFAPGEWISNPNGSWSSEESMTVPWEGDESRTWANIPSLWLKDGKPYVAHDEDEALGLAKASGLDFHTYPNEKEANDAAQAREDTWQGIAPQDASQIDPLWHPPPSYVSPDRRFTDARAEGYSWDDIASHVAGASSQAAAEGYTQDEIDRHLGFDPGSDYAGQTATTALASNPDLLKSVQTGSPVDLSVAPDLRGQYAYGLLSGAVKGPNDFAGGFASALLDSAHSLFGIDDNSPDAVRSRAAAAQDAADTVAADLPHPADLTDAALHLSFGDPEPVPYLKQNLLQTWQETGLHPIPAALAAETDPVLSDKLTTPPQPSAWLGDPEAQAAAEMSRLMQPAIEAHLAGAFADFKEGLEKQSIESRQIVEDAMKEVGTTDPLDPRVLARVTTDPRGIEAATSIAFAAMTNPLERLGPVKIVDVAKSSAEAITEKPAADAFTVPAPAKMIEQTVAEGEAAKPAQIDPQAGPFAKMQRLLLLVDEREAEEAKIGTGTYFQDLVAKGERDGVLQSDPAVTELAKGYDDAVGVRGFLRSLMDDEQGAVKLPAFRTPAATAARSIFTGKRDIAQAMIVKSDALGNQEIAHWSDKLEPQWKAISPHLSEWERELTKGPAGNPMNTVIGQVLDYIEGRSAGVTLAPDHPLKPFADAIREAEQAMDAKLRQQAQAGVINYDGYIQDHFRHQWESPSSAQQNFAGVGKMGERGGLRERTTFPTMGDGIRAGRMPRFTNPLEAELHDLTGKIKYSHAADMLDMARDDGHLYWATSPHDPASEIAVNHALGRKLFAIADASGQPKPGEIKLYGNAGFVKQINTWLSLGLHATPAGASAYDKLIYAKNTTTGLKLAWPAFHAVVEGVGSLASGFGQAIEEGARGQFLSAFANLGKTLTVIPNIADNLRTGYRARAAYVKMANDPIVQQLTEAGLSVTSARTRSLENMTSAPGLLTSLARGSLTRELAKDVKDIFGNPRTEAEGYRALRVPDRTVQFALKEAGRLMQTVTAPFFDSAIPALKAGAAYRRMQSFLQANPTAAPDVVQRYASQVVRDVDNRMGELNFDTVFWPKAAKQTAQIATISASWAYGSFRGFAAALGLNLDKMALEWNPVATSSLIGTAMSYGYANMLLQFLHTGTTPFQSDTPLKDFLNYRTGARTAQGTPERGMVPSELKEVYDLAKIAMFSVGQPSAAFQGMQEYALAKANPWGQGVRAVFTGEDAVGHKIANTPGGWGQYLKNNFGPIFYEQFAQRRSGTGISRAETAMGFREAAKFVESPDDYLKGLAGIRSKWTAEELRRAQRENSALENPDPEIGQSSGQSRTRRNGVPVYGGQGATPFYGNKSRRY